MIRLRSPSPSEAAPKSGASGAHHLVVECLGVDQVRVGVVAAEIRQRHEVARRALRRAEPVFQDLLGIGAGHGVHGVERHAEAALEHRADRVEIEQRLHQFGIVGDRIDHLDRHAARLDGADRVEVDRADVGDLVARDRLGAGEDRVGDLFRRRAAIADIVLDAEILVRAAGIVAGRQDDAAEGLVFADDIARRPASTGCRPARRSPCRNRWRRPCAMAFWMTSRL